MFSRPPKQVFVQPAVGQDARGTHPAAPQQAADGRFTPPHRKRALLSIKNAVLSAVFATTPARKTNRCAESVKSADVVSGAAAAGGAV